MQSAAPPGSIGLFISIFLLILIAENLTSGSSSSTRVKKDGAVSAITGKEKIKSSCIPCHLVAGSIKAIKSLMSELELISESHCSSSHNQQIKDDGEETRGARAFLPMHLSPHQMYYHPQLMMHHPAIMSNKINYGQQQQQQNSYIMPRAPARHQQHFVNYNFPRQVTMQSPAFNNRQLKFTQPGPVQQLALIRPQLLSSPITTTPSNVINNPADLTTKENIIIQETSADINNYDKQNKKKKKKKQMCSKRRNKNKRRKLSNKKQANRVESISLGDDDDDDEDDDGGNDYSNDRVKGNETTTSTVAAANYHESILPLNRGNLTNYKTDDISSTRV